MLISTIKQTSLPAIPEAINASRISLTRSTIFPCLSSGLAHLSTQNHSEDGKKTGLCPTIGCLLTSRKNGRKDEAYKSLCAFYTCIRTILLISLNKLLAKHLLTGVCIWTAWYIA